jgi:hypothetical protein
VLNADVVLGMFGACVGPNQELCRAQGVIVEDAGVALRNHLACFERVKGSCIGYKSIVKSQRGERRYSIRKGKESWK